MLRSVATSIVHSDLDREPTAMQPMVMNGVYYQSNGHPILHDFNMQLPSHGCTAVMGFNGAGKSVLLRLLHGLISPSRGTIRWGEASDPRLARRSQAMVFQKPVLLRRSVEGNLRYVLKRSGLRGDALKEEIEGLLQLGHLTPLRSRPATVLSGGEAQRLALVRALACRPEVLFLDEPTASLDPAATLAIEQILYSAVQNGIHVVLVTQDVPQAKRLASDVVFIHRGKLLEHRKISEFIDHPATAEATAFLEGRLL